MSREYLKKFTYLECLECCSVHTMEYFEGYYECEECYRNVHSDEAPNDEIQIDWKGFKSFILDNKTPRTIIRKFIYWILKMDYDETDIDNLINELKNYGTFMGH
jgi:hypothetical protein